MTESIELANEGFRRAPTREERAYEAAKLFGKGRNPNNILAQAVLLEAFSTSDFPVLLGDAFERQALAAWKDTPKEFESILVDITVPDFERRKLVDLWGADAFERVLEGEEYKSGGMSETDLDHGTAKWGKNYGLTWELRLRRFFSGLANFPRMLGEGAVKAMNKSVADLLTTGSGWDTAYFGTVDTKPLTGANLDAAIKAMSLVENHRGELVSTDNLVLLHGPALRGEVNRLLSASKLVTVEDGVTTEVDNPYRGLVTPLESRSLGVGLGTKQGTAWALVQSSNSDLPSLIRTTLEGHPEVDIRVKRDQGDSIGGGAVGVEDGAFKDDTIWYRGRSVFNVEKAFTTGVYASNGAA